jgi:mRNA interferase MazF
MEFNPQKEHEIRGTRPALILSPESYNAKVGHCVVCAITSRIKGYPFEVIIPETNVIEGVILTDQVRTIDWRELNVRYASSVSQSILTDVFAKLNTLLT